MRRAAPATERLVRALRVLIYPPRLSFAQTAADNARSRMKTNLPAKDGDEDLIEYYYIIQHPFTQSGFDYRRSVGKKFWKETAPRLKARFGEDAPGLYKGEDK